METIQSFLVRYAVTQSQFTRPEVQIVYELLANQFGCMFDPMEIEAPDYRSDII